MRLAVLLLFAAALWAAEPKRLPAEDALRVRELQLQISQAHASQLQAEKVYREAAETQKAAEKALAELVKAVTEKHCKGCELQADLSFKEPPAPKPESKK